MGILEISDVYFQVDQRWEVCLAENNAFSCGAYRQAGVPCIHMAAAMAASCSANGLIHLVHASCTTQSVRVAHTGILCHALLTTNWYKAGWSDATKFHPLVQRMFESKARVIHGLPEETRDMLNICRTWAQVKTCDRRREAAARPPRVL
jgi:hypothetical protein